MAILSRLVAAPRTIEPDALARRPRTPVFHPVSTRTTIGTGDTRIELLPVRGETGERMMIAWLPGALPPTWADVLAAIDAAVR